MSSRSGSHGAGTARSSRRARGDSALSNAGKKENRSFISVAVRVRPRLRREGADADTVESLEDGKSIVITDGNQRKQFTVDRVFDSRTPDGGGQQEKIFNEFGKALVAESLNGYNVCIFAYGHTGSGKTYTMLGDGGTSFTNITGDQAGILPRFLQEIFKLHSEDVKDVKWGYTCEFYEVYNEQVKDLLAPDKTDRPPKVHVHPKHGVRVENLTTSVVGSAEETLGLVNFGNQMRTVAATTMNERSSRSHAIFTFRFEPLEGGPAGSSFQSTVMFADLAGREDKFASQNKAMQFREMCFINTSLFHLAHLITKLSDGSVDKNSWTDFRNSKLTLLLSHALVGNSRTALIATLTPLQSYYEDTVSTMNFAQSVKKIKTRPTVNNKSPKVMINELEAEVRRLNKELSESTSSNTEKETELSTAQALIEHYKVSWEEAKANSERTKRRRKTVIQAAGLLDLMEDRSNSLPLLPNGGVYPFFTKLSDDPSLQGCCNYFLCKNSMRVGSDMEECDIRLQGVGINEMMCDVMCDEEGHVKVEILERDFEFVPRVLVRGTPLVPETMPCMEMMHGDCIILGYAHAFRLVAATREMAEEVGIFESMDARDLARSTLPDMDMTSALSEIEEAASSASRNVAQYIAGLSMQMPGLPEHEVEELQQAIRCICPLVDEANVITHEVCGADGVHFEIRSLTGIFDSEPPDLVVCVLQRLQRLGEAIITPDRRRAASAQGRMRGFSFGADQDRANDQELEVKHHIWKAWNPVAQAMGLSEHMKIGGEMALLYVWPLEKFFWRLGEIRDIYQEGSESGDNFAGVRLRLSKKPHLNPWREVTIDEERLPTQERSHVVKDSHRRYSVPIDFTPGFSRKTSMTEGLTEELFPQVPSKKEQLLDLPPVKTKTADTESAVESAIKSAVAFAVQGDQTTVTSASAQGHPVSLGPAGLSHALQAQTDQTGERRAQVDGHDLAQLAGHQLGGHDQSRSSLRSSASVAAISVSAAPSPGESIPFREAAKSNDAITQRYHFYNLPKTRWDAPAEAEENEARGSAAGGSTAGATARDQLQQPASAVSSQVDLRLSHRTVPSFSAEAAELENHSEFKRQDSIQSNHSAVPSEKSELSKSRAISATDKALNAAITVHSCLSTVLAEPDPLTRAALWLDKTDQRASTNCLTASQRSNKSVNSAASATASPPLPALQLRDVQPSSNPVANIAQALPAPEERPSSRRRRTDSSLSRLEKRRPSVSSTGGPGMGGGDESPRLAQSLHEMWGKIDGFCQELRQRDEQVNQLTDERDRISGLLQTLLNRFQPNQEHPSADPNQQDQLRSIAEGLQGVIDRVNRLEHSPSKVAAQQVTVCLSPRRAATIRPPGPVRSAGNSPRSIITPAQRGFAWPIGGPVASPGSPREFRAESPLKSVPIARVSTDGTLSPSRSVPIARVPVVAVTASAPSSRPLTPATPSVPAGVFQAVCRSPRGAQPTQVRQHSPLARNSLSPRKQQSTPSRSGRSPPARDGNAAVVAMGVRTRPTSPARSVPSSQPSWGGSSTAPVPLPGSFTVPLANSFVPKAAQPAAMPAGSASQRPPSQGSSVAASVTDFTANRVGRVTTQGSSNAASTADCSIMCGSHTVGRATTQGSGISDCGKTSTDSRVVPSAAVTAALARPAQQRYTQERVMSGSRLTQEQKR